MTPSVIRFKSKKDIPTLVFALLWLSIYIYKLDTFDNLFQTGPKNVIFLTLGLLLTTLFIYKIVWILTGGLSLCINYEQLVVKKHLLGFSFSKKYLLNNIRNLKTTGSEKANTYWGFDGFRFNDTGDTALLSFEYNNKTILIGQQLNNFNAQLVLEKIIKKPKLH